MSYVTLSDGLYNRLLPMVAAGTIKSLTQYEISSSTGYPYICVLEDDTVDEEQPFDTTLNEANYRFKVRIVENAANMAGATQNVRVLADDVLTRIREDLTFGCTVLKTGLSVRWGYLNEENTRICDISVSFKLLVDI